MYHAIKLSLPLLSKLRKEEKIALAIAIVAIAAGAGFYFYKSYFLNRPAPQARPPAAVSVAEVIEREVRLSDEFSGKLTAVDQVEVRPRVSGVIEAIHFKEGAMVKKNAPLFIIDRPLYQAELSRAQGGYLAAAAQEALAEADAMRGENLYEAHAISKREYEQRKNAIANAKATVKSRLADVEIAKLNLGYAEVRAPVSGKIGRPEVTKGNLIAAGTTILTTIASIDPMYADFEIDEATFLLFANAEIKNVGEIPVKMTLMNGSSHEGHIRSFDNRINSESGTVRVRAVFDNPKGKLVPGMFAHIQLFHPDKTLAILVSDRAILTDQDKKIVLVVGSDNKVQPREVKLGSMVDNLRAIKEGLKAGEKIIINGTQKARPGMEVAPEIVEMK